MSTPKIKVTLKRSIHGQLANIRQSVHGLGLRRIGHSRVVIDTPANRAAMPAADHAAWPRPEQLAETIAFLASPANTLTSGALVPVYGRA